jgi:hypothetical protein
MLCLVSVRSECSYGEVRGDDIFRIDLENLERVKHPPHNYSCNLPTSQRMLSSARKLREITIKVVMGTVPASATADFQISMRMPRRPQHQVSVR